MTTLNLQVSASADDAFQDNSGNTHISQASNNCDDVNENHAFRWQNVTIPNGSTINSATLSVWIIDNNNDEPWLRFWGVAQDNVAGFTEEGTGAEEISMLPATTATVDWDNADLGIGAGGGWASPPDLAAIIQEIVNRAGWASGNALALVCSQPSLLGARDCGVEYYDGNTSEAAKLDISYTAASTGIPNVLGLVAQTRKQTRRITGVRRLSR